MCQVFNSDHKRHCNASDQAYKRSYIEPEKDRRAPRELPSRIPPKIGQYDLQKTFEDVLTGWLNPGVPETLPLETQHSAGEEADEDPEMEKSNRQSGSITDGPHPAYKYPLPPKGHVQWYISQGTAACFRACDTLDADMFLEMSTTDDSSVSVLEPSQSFGRYIYSP